MRNEEDIMRGLHITILFAVFCWATAALPQSVQEGQVTAMNEQGGTVTLKLKDGSTKEYRLEDGLVFSAVQVGDNIRFTINQVGGQAVLNKIEKQ